MVRLDRVKYLCEVLKSISTEEMDELSQRAANENGWFTKDSVTNSIRGILYMLEEDKLEKWIEAYKTATISKNVGLVMAGNIPLVGFHDLLSVYLSGHNAIVKLSHQDKVLMNFVIDILTEDQAESVQVVERLKGIDAVIATGSTNTSRYFEYYFGKYPNVIRKNRSSIAILTGDESDDDLYELGKDVFSYFGLGCRNVTSLMLPEGYNMEKLGSAWQEYSNIINHHKYANNYDYNKSILLINQEAHLDFGYLLARESSEIFSPISVLNFSYYNEESKLKGILELKKNEIQCIVGKEIPFGKAQMPELWDYADGLDTMKFLESI